MHFDEALTGRRSVRSYTADPVDERIIHGLVEAAIQAPSAMNEQPCSFTVVREPGLLDRISRDAKAHMLANMPPSRHSDRFQAMLSDPDFQIFHRAPVLILISAIAAGPFIVEDCALAAGNLMLSAYAAGLGSCWIGFAQSFLGSAPGKAALDLPAAWVPVAPIIVGHPKATPPRVPRNPPVLHWIG